jgi:hypothetical protein
VTFCWTGKPTSTFGGGGGTKLFCSQPLKAVNANNAKAMCETTMAPCPVRPFGAAHTGKRGDFISIPNSSWPRKGIPQFNDSNNPLAV